jgi:hypothetical protein
MTRIARLAPTLCVLLVALGYLGWVLARSSGDAVSFAYLGTRFSVPEPGGTEGYDGQFNYYIASDPNPQTVRAHLDVPAYRYQHILYPLLARALALGNADAIPWTLVAINLLCLAGITLLAGELLSARGGSRWGAIPIGLWVGLISGVRLDLSEPLALFLVIAALYLSGPELRRRIPLVALLLALAMLTKETMLPFVAGWAAWLAWRRDFRGAALILAALIPFGLFQFWLGSTFGAPGLASGGAGATPFMPVPFLGLIQVGGESLKLLAVLLIVYVPGLLLPALYGLIAPGIDAFRRRDTAQRRITPDGVLLFFNAVMIALAPFSTFREPLGITRLACGLIGMMWLYAASDGKAWWSKLGLVGLAYLPFILR